MCAPKKAAWRALRDAQQFAAVMQQGRVVSKSPHFLIHAVRLPHIANHTPAQAASLASFKPTSAQFYGMLLSKRWARTAVRRNVIKRQVRSILAQHGVQLELPSSHIALVVRLHSSWNAQQFVSAASHVLRMAVRQELLALFQHARWHKAPTIGLTTELNTL